MKEKINKNIFLRILISLTLWSLFWFLGQALFFYNNLPFQNLDSNAIFFVITIWILFLAIIALFLWKWKFNDFSFLQVKNRKILWFYSLPVILTLIFLIKGLPVGINRFAYVFAMVTTTFLAQDMLTFGFLQTYLEKLITPFCAFILTSLVFFIAHLTFDFSFFTLIFAFGALLFGYLRYKTKNIYLLNILHTAFLLLPF